MTWNDITVQQFQQLSEIWQEKEREPFFVNADLVEVCYRLTRQQLDSLPYEEYTQLLKDLKFLNDYPDWKPVRHVDIDGRRYRFVYDVRQIHAARNIEVKHFGKDFIQNLHKMAASMVIPQHRHKMLWWRWVDETYNAAKHEQYAKDLLQAPITAIYGSALFFCEVFRKSIEDMADSLTSQMQTTPELKETARQLLLDSCKILDGSTRLPQSPSWSGLP